MSNSITQHIPSWAEGFDPKCSDFNSASELLALDWVKVYAQEPNFHRFSLNGDTLMIERNEGKDWWVVGRISKPSEVDLPVWKPSK